MLAFMIHRVNGIANAVPGHRSPSPAFRRAAQAYEALHEVGSAELVHARTEGEYAMAISDYEGREPVVRTLLDALQLGDREIDGELIMLPLQAGIGRVPGRVTLETRSVLAMLRSIGEAIDLPKEHLDSGVVGAHSSDFSPVRKFLRIRSSAAFPSNATVAISHRGYWFYIDATDTLSKRAFVLMRTLVGIRLSDPNAQARSPALTIPVN